MSEESKVYSFNGFCPICENDVVFTSKSSNFRGNLLCNSCVNFSIPRERALALVLKKLIPDWRDKIIHESSPVHRGFSPQLKQECKGYIVSQFFPSEPLGAIVKGFRNENLESQTFPDESIDISISLDVFEHVNMPDLAIKDIARTLKHGGYCIFTAPTYPGKLKTERRAFYRPDGTKEILVGEAEYHGNPVNSEGSLVTFHYGFDFPELLYSWSGLHIEVFRFHDPLHGIIGAMTEVYSCYKK